VGFDLVIDELLPEGAVVPGPCSRRWLPPHVLGSHGWRGCCQLLLPRHFLAMGIPGAPGRLLGWRQRLPLPQVLHGRGHGGEQLVAGLGMDGMCHTAHDEQDDESNESHSILLCTLSIARA